MGLNLLGIALIVWQGLRFRLNDSELEDLASSGGTPRAWTTFDATATNVARRLDRFLALTLPRCEVRRQGERRFALLNRRLVDGPVFSWADEPLFSHGGVSLRGDGEHTEAGYFLDYRRYRNAMVRMFWIVVVFISMPHVIVAIYGGLGRTRDVLRLLPLIHLAWPCLVWTLYRVNVRRGEGAVQRALELAAAL